MNIEHLREFSYLAETLSFNITAKHFFISTSVLSKHIAAMEGDLGVRLFERDRHGVELTREGYEFYKGVTCVLADYDNAVERISPERLRKRKTFARGLPARGRSALPRTFRGLLQGQLPRYRARDHLHGVP